jgi:hypothetical protein
MSAEADWIRTELVNLWYDLIREERLSLVPRSSGKWSMKMEGVGERIKGATQLVGPANWRDIPALKILDGWFKRTNKVLGIEANLPTEEELTELRDRIGTP